MKKWTLLRFFHNLFPFCKMGGEEIVVILHIIKAALLKNDFNSGDFIETALENHSDLNTWINKQKTPRKSSISCISTPHIGLALKRFVSKYRR